MSLVTVRVRTRLVRLGLGLVGLAVMVRVDANEEITNLMLMKSLKGRCIVTVIAHKDAISSEKKTFFSGKKKHFFLWIGTSFSLYPLWEGVPLPTPYPSSPPSHLESGSSQIYVTAHAGLCEHVSLRVNCRGVITHQWWTGLNVCAPLLSEGVSEVDAYA